MSCTCRPLMPPAALISSPATCEPFSVDWPKLDVCPVRSPYTPILIVPPGSAQLPPRRAQVADANTASIRATGMRIRFIVHLTERFRPGFRFADSIIAASLGITQTDSDAAPLRALYLGLVLSPRALFFGLCTWTSASR